MPPPARRVAAVGAAPAEGPTLAAAVDGQRTRPRLGAIPRRRRGLVPCSGRGGDSVCRLRLVEIHFYVLGIPFFLVIVVVALTWSRKGPPPAPYKMSEPWTHPPILWAAT